MRLNFFDKNLKPITQVYSWISLLTVDGYNDLGAFTVEFVNTPKLKNISNTMIYCTVDDNKEVYIVTSVQLDQERIILTGFPAIFILSKRVSVEVLRNGNAETLLRDLVSNMSVWDNLILGDIDGVTDLFDRQTSDGTILKYCEEIAKYVDMGFRIIKVGDKLWFECYKPKLNATNKFATSLKNIQNLTFDSSETQFANVVIIAGSGTGKNRTTVIVGDTSVTGFDRREIYVDAKSIQPQENESQTDYESRLKVEGFKKLAESQKIKSVTFDLLGNQSLKLGDLVDVELTEFSIILRMRVTEVTMQSQDNHTNRTVSLSAVD